MTTYLLAPGSQQSDANGVPASGARLFTYEAGTSTPKPTYSDAGLTIANANPVVANAGGVFGPVIATTGAYKLEMQTATGAVLWTADPVDGAPADVELSVRDNVEPLLFNSTYTVWQRGTSVAIPASSTTVATVYGADGWAMNTAAGQNCTVSQQAPIADGGRFAMRVQRDSGQTGTTVLLMQQWLPTDHIAQLRGRQVTFSADVRVGPTFSGTLQMVVWAGTGTEGRRVSAYTNEILLINTAALAITTTTQRFTFTSGAVVPANTTQMMVGFRWAPSGTAGATDYYEVGRPVLSAAPGIDPPFVSASYELQRAYRWFKVIPAGVRCASYTGAGGTVSTAVDYATMRATPAASGTASATTNVATGPTFTPTTDRVEITATATALGATTFTMNAITLDARL
jgi:hypothetical protein